MILYFMLIHKDIIARVIFAFFFITFTFWVLGPVFLNFIKKKLPWSSSEETDIDVLIKRQKERLRSQYGLVGEVSSSSIKNPHPEGPPKKTTTSREMQEIKKEIQWGGGAFLKELQTEITKGFSYTIADTKVSSFVLLCEKRKYFHFLNEENQNDSQAIKNYMVALLIFFLMLDEVKEKKFYIIDKIARKLHVPSQELALALQLKLLMTVAQKSELKEERIYSENLVLNQYSEDTIKSAVEIIAKREANLWARGASLFFEELTLALNYAMLISPLPRLQNKKDLEGAHQILGVNINDSLEDIKKVYKKLALQKHPDKVTGLKLPKVLEKKAIERFNQIQEAHEVILALKK